MNGRKEERKTVPRAIVRKRSKVTTVAGSAPIPNGQSLGTYHYSNYSWLLQVPFLTFGRLDCFCGITHDKPLWSIWFIESRSRGRFLPVKNDKRWMMSSGLPQNFLHPSASPPITLSHSDESIKLQAPIIQSISVVACTQKGETFFFFFFT